MSSVIPGSSDSDFTLPSLFTFISQTLGCKVTFPVISSTTSFFDSERILLSQIFNLYNFLSTSLGILSFSKSPVFTV